MSRPIEEGLQYFPLDVDIFDDPKLLFVAERFDSKGEIIAIKLLCWIYRNGYYCEWSDEHALIFAKKNFSNIKSALCQDVVRELIKRDFFDEGIFERFGILTSKAIQARWQNVIDRSRRKAKLKPELNLLVQEETRAEQTLTPSKHTESTQSKVKESKVKESKVNNKTNSARTREGGNLNGYQPQQIPLPETAEDVIEIGAMRSVPPDACRMYFELRGRDNFLRNTKQGWAPILNWHKDLFLLHSKGALENNNNQNKKRNGSNPQSKGDQHAEALREILS